MKQIPLTPQIIADIKASVGEDVDPAGFAVFEAIALNTLPLPGKKGSIFENAQVSYLTLLQMADSVNGGNHLPLIQDHDMSGTPTGRVFKANTHLTTQGQAELRVLFYLDPTEDVLIAKLNAGSLDETSVNFLASQILCSECGFDYRGEDASYSHLAERTCANGHTVGEDGVHVRLVGLHDFAELSLVTRGAASNPKIVGKSQSKLAAPLQALAAKGFEIDQLYLTASKGEFVVNFEALVAQVTETSAKAAKFETQLDAVTAERDTLVAKRDEDATRIAELTTQLAEAKASATPDAAAVAELALAKDFLGSLLTKLATAAGETDVTPPSSVAELQAGIEKHQSALSAILPIGGVADRDDKSREVGAKFSASHIDAFRVTQ